MCVILFHWYFRFYVQLRQCFSIKTDVYLTYFSLDLPKHTSCLHSSKTEWVSKARMDRSSIFFSFSCNLSTSHLCQWPSNSFFFLLQVNYNVNFIQTFVNGCLFVLICSLKIQELEPLNRLMPCVHIKLGTYAMKIKQTTKMTDELIHFMSPLGINAWMESKALEVVSSKNTSRY